MSGLKEPDIEDKNGYIACWPISQTEDIVFSYQYVWLTPSVLLLQAIAAMI